MSDYLTVFDHVRGLAEQHLPHEAMPSVLAIAIVLAGGGILLSVLGARLAKGALTFAFLIGGGLAAAGVARHLGWGGREAALLVAGGVVVSGLLGYFVFRLWVGVVVAVLLATVGSIAFNQARILPALKSFDHAAYVASGAGGERFALLDPAVQADYAKPTPQRWVRDFVNDLTTRDPGVRRSVGVAAVCWGAVGLLLGALLTRFTLITLTSAIGTAAFAGGAALLAANLRPDDYARATAQPLPIAIGVGACFVAALVLQTLMTRRAPAAKPAAPATASA